MEREDFYWYQELIRQDIHGCELTAVEEQKVIEGAMAAAEDMCSFVRERYSFVHSRDLAKKMGMDIVEQSDASQHIYSYFGLYLPQEQKIILNLEAIQRTEQFIEECVREHVFLIPLLSEIVSYHEIFHGLEERFPDIYTRSQMICRKRFGLFPYQRGLSSASEIGAIHFSKQILSLSYSPCIYGEYYRQASVLMGY